MLGRAKLHRGNVCCASARFSRLLGWGQFRRTTPTSLLTCWSCTKVTSRESSTFASQAHTGQDRKLDRSHCSCSCVCGARQKHSAGSRGARREAVQLMRAFGASSIIDEGLIGRTAQSLRKASRGSFFFFFCLAVKRPASFFFFCISKFSRPAALLLRASEREWLELLFFCSARDSVRQRWAREEEAAVWLRKRCWTRRPNASFPADLAICSLVSAAER